MKYISHLFWQSVRVQLNIVTIGCRDDTDKLKTAREAFYKTYTCDFSHHTLMEPDACVISGYLLQSS